MQGRLSSCQRGSVVGLGLPGEPKMQDPSCWVQSCLPATRGQRGTALSTSQELILPGSVISTWVRAREHPAGCSELAGCSLVLDHPSTTPCSLCPCSFCWEKLPRWRWAQLWGLQLGPPRSIPFGGRAPALLRRKSGSLQTFPSPETQDKRDPSWGFWQAGNIPATCMKG